MKSWGLLPASILLSSGELYPIVLRRPEKMGYILISCIDPNYIVFLTEGIEVKANLPYFSNISNIQYYNNTSSNTRVVFDNVRYAESLECNLRDHKIYWIDHPEMIKRGNPNDPTSIETVSPYCIVL